MAFCVNATVVRGHAYIQHWAHALYGDLLGNKRIAASHGTRSASGDKSPGRAGTKKRFDGLHKAARVSPTFPPFLFPPLLSGVINSFTKLQTGEKLTKCGSVCSKVGQHDFMSEFYEI